MKNLTLLLSSRLKNVLSLVVGSTLARHRLKNGSTPSHHMLAVLCLLVTMSVGNAWGGQITITSADITDYPSTAAYGERSWTDSGISGKAKVYGSTSSHASLQFNSSNRTIWNTTALPGNITSIVMKTASGTNRAWIVRGGASAATNSSTDSYGSAIGSSTTVTTSGTTFTVTSGEYKYFLCYLNASNASYIESIVINYEDAVSCANGKVSTPVVTTTPSDGQVVLSWDAIDHSNGYQYKWNGGSWTDVNTTSVTKTGLTNGTSYTYQVLAKGASTYCDSDPSASASVKPGPRYTVSFSTGTGNPAVSPITEDEYEGGIELPDGPTPDCSAAGWEFAGWSETEYTVDNTTNVGRLRMPEDYFYPDDDVTLYAVYRKLTSGTSSATFTANSRDNLTQISSGTKRPAWWYHTSTGVEFYIKDYGYYSYYDVFDVDNSINNGDGWALFDAHRPITTITLTSLSGSPSVSLTSKEDVDGNSVSISSSTITCSGNVTQVLFDAPNNGEVTFSAFTVNYKNCKFLSSPTCASCDNDPTVTAASNNGSISSTSVPVQCESGISNIGGEGCTITSYGFCWAPSATTTTPTTSNSSHEVGTSYTVASTAFNYTITGLTPNTEYTIRPYATNGHGTAYGSAYTVTTLQRYAISYNSNGGSNSMDGAYKDHGVAFALPSTAGSMTKTGYHATGWLLGSSSGTHYDLSGSYTTNEAATFYVEWTANTYEVAFNNNGGSGSMSNESFTYDAASKALTTCTFTPPEHKYFTGWNTAPEGGGTSYTEGQSVQNLTSTNNGTVTLYAQWADHTYTNYTTTCCATKITMAKSITGNGTVTFGKTSVPTCGGGSTTMTITPDAGWTLSTFTPSGVSPSSTSPAVATDEPDEQEITVTFAADASGTYTATVVFVALHDKYFDRLHGNGESEEGGYHYYDKSGTGYSVPAPDEGDKTTGDDCTKEHYHFVGWLNADFLNSDGTPNTGAVGYEGPFSGGTKNATGATYYAIWSKEME